MNETVAVSADLTSRVRSRLLERSSDDPLDARVRSLVLEEAPLLTPAAHSSAVAAVLADVAGLGSLEPLLADPEVTEVMVNGPGRVWIERAGEFYFVKMRS